MVGKELSYSFHVPSVSISVAASCYVQLWSIRTGSGSETKQRPVYSYNVIHLIHACPSAFKAYATIHPIDQTLYPGSHTAWTMQLLRDSFPDLDHYTSPQMKDTVLHLTNLAIVTYMAYG